MWACEKQLASPWKRGQLPRAYHGQEHPPPPPAILSSPLCLQKHDLSCWCKSLAWWVQTDPCCLCSRWSHNQTCSKTCIWSILTSSEGKHTAPDSYVIYRAEFLTSEQARQRHSSDLKKLGSSWIKTGEMEKKDATIYEAIPYPSRERGRLYHHWRSLSSCSAWIAPTSRHPDLQLVRSGCCNQGSLGRDGWFAREEGLPLSSPSPQRVCAVHCMCSYWPFVELQFSLSRVWLFLRGTSRAHTAPTHTPVPPADLCCKIPPCCSLWEALCCAHRLFPFGPGKLPFLFTHYFTRASAFCSQSHCVVCHEGQA